LLREIGNNAEIPSALKDKLGELHKLGVQQKTL